MPALKPGEQAEIYLTDGSPALRGHVESIARGITDRDNLAGPELLVNPNRPSKWVRLAQRIPVRIHIDDVPKGVLVSSGMTATVVVEATPRQWATLAALRGWQAPCDSRRIGLSAFHGMVVLRIETLDILDLTELAMSSVNASTMRR